MDRAVSAPRSASGAPPQRGNWGANRGYSVLYSLKNAASRVKLPLIKTWRLNLLCTSLRPAWDHTHSASLEPGLPLQLAPRSGAEDFSCGDAVDVWPRRFRRGGQPPPHLRFARRDEKYLVRGPVMQLGKKNSQIPLVSHTPYHSSEDKSIQRVCLGAPWRARAHIRQLAY